MSTPRWVHYKNDKCYGHNDANGNADTFNRASKDVWSNLIRHYDSGNGGKGEHDRDGDHCSDLLTDAGVYAVEPITYTGNGADDRDIALTDTGLDIKFIRIFEGSTAYTYFRSESTPGDLTLCTSSLTAANQIQSVGTGTFQVGTALNVNLRVYYGVVYGLS